MALINLLILYFLVPESKGEGAAIAMLITFLAWNILAFGTSQRLWPINYPWTILLGQLALGLFSTQVLLYFFETGKGIWNISLFASASALALIVSSAKFSTFQDWYKTLNFSK